MIIKFTKDEIDKVYDFAEKIKSKHRAIHFMDKNNAKLRSERELMNVIVEGKLAEVAICKYLNGFNNLNVSEVDFNIYGKGITDECDLKVNGKTLSIKSSKPNSSCLLMETARFDIIGDKVLVESKEAPNYVAFARVESTKGKEYAEICGVIEFNEYWRIKRFMPKGFKMCRKNAVDYLLNNKELKDLDFSNAIRGKELLADNYGIHIKKLRGFDIIK